jgi:hypothetical protein
VSGQPVILVVDDDMSSLTISEQELRKRYGLNGDGDSRLRKLTLEQLDSGDREVAPADALFVMIGPTRTLAGFLRRSRAAATGTC